MIVGWNFDAFKRNHQGCLIEIYHPCANKDCFRFGSIGVVETTRTRGIWKKTNIKVVFVIAENNWANDCCYCKEYTGIPLHKGK